MSLKIKNRLKQLENINKGIKVGFLSNSRYPDGTSVPAVAAKNEFGDPSNNQPPRPFFRSAVSKNGNKWVTILGNAVSSGYDVDTALSTVGVEAIADIQKSIIDFKNPPNAPLTIKLKGFNNPLIDTRVMLKSVDMEIVDETSSDSE